MFSFCKPLSSKKRFAPHRKLNDDFTFSLYDRAAAIPENEWVSITKEQTVFLEKSYLSLLETCTHSKLTCRYVTVFCNKIICGIIYFQVIDFKAEVFGELMKQQLDNLRSKRLKMFEKYLDSNKDDILLRLFTCGNNLISGEYGFLFNNTITKKQGTEIVLELTQIISKEEKLRGTISATLIKDFYTQLEPKSFIEKEGYSDFLVEPNLIIDIPASVTSLETYVALFSKKYRKRARGIFESFEGIEVVDLDAEGIYKHEKELYSLYESIFENAKFKLLKLPKNYFSAVKKIYPTNFHVKGFMLNGKLLAFGSCFVMPNQELEAHYIGFDYPSNNLYNLYQNLLYHLVAEAIKFKCTRINLGRTASEIKTTVGAKPHDLWCYIKPQNTISKLIQKPFISFLQPTEWIARNPFKEDVSHQENSVVTKNKN